MAKPEDMSLSDMMAMMKSLFDHPALKRLVELDEWAKSKGMTGRSEFNTAMVDFFIAAPSPELAKEYVEKMMAIHIDVGPALMHQLRSIGK